MTSFDLNSINAALTDSGVPENGVDFSGKSLKLDTEKDAQPIVDAINACKHLHYLALTGNTLGVAAAEAISKALKGHPELKIARFSDMFTGRMKTEIPPALSALGEGMITAGAHLTVLELSDNAFGPIGVEGLTKLLQSDVCSQLEELRLNNNGLGITGGRLLANALAAKPRKLRVFIAGRNRLENEGASALAQVFKDMGTLEEIAMPQNGIYHVGVSALSKAFEHNPNLSCLNLNDNTIGVKGAAAIAAAMPKLKNLKSINFGDCLLKSKGAKTLAAAFKDNSILLESLDMSHNEIGHSACMELVDAVTALPDAVERLARVSLSGNNFGSVDNKRIMKEKLGPSAEFSDGECSDGEPSEGDGDDAYDSGADDSNSEDSTDSADSEDSKPEDVQHQGPVVVDITSEIEEQFEGLADMGTEVQIFLETPTMENLKALGPRAADLIEAHIKEKRDQTEMFTALVEATFCVSGLSEGSSLAMEVAQKLYKRLLVRVRDGSPTPWLIANAMLRGLGLIKSENKDYRIRWNTAGCYSALAKAFITLDFPPVIRDTIRLFISSQLQQLPDNKLVMRYPQLYEYHNLTEDQQMTDMVKLQLKFGGGAELLFDKIKKRELELPALKKYFPDCQREKWNIRYLLVWIKDNLLRERPELFLQGDSVRPGILVLINDADWELYGELEYELQDDDVIMFISTLHGG
ncbi:unnamed protein product, partial [Iphiclides podalirius]